MTRLSRSESRQRTRSLLLDAAARVFARRGYHGASLDDIAAEAGFSKGAVYSNFESKEDLFLALLDRRRVDQEAELRRAFGDAPDAVPGGLGRTVAPVDQEAWEWGLLTLEFFLFAVRQPPVRDRLAASYGETRAALAELLVDRWPALSAGRLEPTELATIALALGTGLGVQAALDPAAVPADLYARTIARLVGEAADGDPR